VGGAGFLRVKRKKKVSLEEGSIHEAKEMKGTCRAKRKLIEEGEKIRA